MLQQSSIDFEIHKDELFNKFQINIFKNSISQMIIV